MISNNNNKQTPMEWLCVWRTGRRERNATGGSAPPAPPGPRAHRLSMIHNR